MATQHTVMMAVPEFSRSLLRKVGAPAGTIKTFIEPPLETPKGKSRPDGALIITRGRTNCRAFVEVKTGTNELYREQIEGYLDLARDNAFQGMITISNQLTTAADKHLLRSTSERREKLGYITSHGWRFCRRRSSNANSEESLTRIKRGSWVS